MVAFKTNCIHWCLLILLLCIRVQSNLQVAIATNLKPVVISNDRVDYITNKNKLVIIRGGKGKGAKDVDLKKVRI